MEDVGHSPLLKFIVTDRKIPNMSEPNFKIQVCFDDSNITSTVPEEQKLRNASPNSNFTEAPKENTGEDGIENSDNSSQIELVHHTNVKDQKQIMAEDDTHQKGDLIPEAPKEDFVLTPVMTNTKEEAVFTKGDLKLQKVTVTEDISVRFQHLFKKQTLPGKTVVTQIQKFEYKY